MKTCVRCLEHGTRIGRSWGAGLKYDEYHVGSGGPTRAEFNMKPAVDVTGNLTITKTANAVTVINTFVAQYVGDLRWDFILIGRECKTSRWGPKEWGFEGFVDVEEFTEGICGLICLGAANDCLGRINGDSFQQGTEGEVVCFTGVGKDANNHFGMFSHEHDFELESAGDIILLGRTCPTLPCTDDGNEILENVRFRINDESLSTDKRLLRNNVEASKIVVAASENVKHDNANYNRVMIEGCTNPGSLLSEKTPWSKGCKVIPIDKNDDWCSSGTLEKCREILTCNRSSLWFSSPCTGGTSWTHINMLRGSTTVNKIKGHWSEFRKLWKRLEEIANFAIPLGVKIFIEWPRGCIYWKNLKVVRFLEKYGFKFADFDGCMYGLVASHGKDAGLPIKKPWRVAYVNSSIGNFLHLKCDGSHEHSPCSGQNTSDTERYTPEIAKAVHLCFCRDTKTGSNRHIDNANTRMPAAVSLLRFPVSHEPHGEKLWLKPFMANRTFRSQGKGEGWPTPKEVVGMQSVPQARGWNRRGMNVTIGGDARGSAGDEKCSMCETSNPRGFTCCRHCYVKVGSGSGARGSADREQKLDVSDTKSPNVGRSEAKFGRDQKVDKGLVGQWKALDNARFIPKQGDRRHLMNIINALAKTDIGLAYEWLKDIIISCRYIIPGRDTFKDVKYKTIAMMRKMLDPDGICGVDIEDTIYYREKAKLCSLLFANVAGELLCQWTEKDNTEGPYSPGYSVENIVGEIEPSMIASGSRS